MPGERSNDAASLAEWIRELSRQLNECEPGDAAHMELQMRIAALRRALREIEDAALPHRPAGTAKSGRPPSLWTVGCGDPDVGWGSAAPSVVAVAELWAALHQRLGLRLSHTIEEEGQTVFFGDILEPVPYWSEDPLRDSEVKSLADKLIEAGCRAEDVYARIDLARAWRAQSPQHQVEKLGCIKRAGGLMRKVEEWENRLLGLLGDCSPTCYQDRLRKVRGDLDALTAEVECEMESWKTPYGTETAEQVRRAVLDDLERTLGFLGYLRVGLVRPCPDETYADLIRRGLRRGSLMRTVNRWRTTNWIVIRRNK